MLVKPRDIPKITEQKLEDWIDSIRQVLIGDDIDLARQSIRQFVAKIVVNQKTATLFYTFPLSDLSRNGMVTPTGYGTPPLPSLNTAIWRVLKQHYKGIPLPISPVTNKHISQDARNKLICSRYANGSTLEQIACDFGLSHQRVYQIIQRWC